MTVHRSNSKESPVSRAELIKKQREFSAGLRGAKLQQNASPLRSQEQQHSTSNPSLQQQPKSPASPPPHASSAQPRRRLFGTQAKDNASPPAKSHAEPRGTKHTSPTATKFVRPRTTSKTPSKNERASTEDIVSPARYSTNSSAFQKRQSSVVTEFTFPDNNDVIMLATPINNNTNSNPPLTLPPMPKCSTPDSARLQAPPTLSARQKRAHAQELLELRLTSLKGRLDAIRGDSIRDTISEPGLSVRSISVSTPIAIPRLSMTFREHPSSTVELPRELAKEVDYVTEARQMAELLKKQKSN